MVAFVTDILYGTKLIYIYLYDIFVKQIFYVTNSLRNMEQATSAILYPYWLWIQSPSRTTVPQTKLQTNIMSL